MYIENLKQPLGRHNINLMRVDSHYYASSSSIIEPLFQEINILKEKVRMSRISQLHNSADLTQKTKLNFNFEIFLTQPEFQFILLGIITL